MGKIEKMKALFFCSNPVDGGTARVFCEIVKSLRDNDAGIKIYAAVNANNPVEIYKCIPDIYYLPIYSEQIMYRERYGNAGLRRVIDYIVRKLRYRTVYFKNDRILSRFIDENAIDTVIIHNGGYVGDDLCNQLLKVAYRKRKFVRNRVMIWHNDMSKGRITKLRYFLYDKKIDREATGIVTVSNYTKDRIKSSSFIRKNIDVIYNGLPDSRCKRYKDKIAFIDQSQDVFQVLMIGNFQANKGQVKLIEALRLVNNCSINVTFIGNVYDEKYYEKCMKAVSEYKLESRVRVLHGINDAYEYIDMFDLLAVTSLYDESFGLISLEAMIAGKPVAAFACGGIPEVVEDGKTGILVPVGNVKKLAEVMIWFYRNKDKAEVMGNNGRKRYERYFSCEAMKNAYLSYFERNCGLK